MESLSHREAKGAAQGHSQAHSQMNPGPSPKAISNLLGADLPSLDFPKDQLTVRLWTHAPKTAKGEDRVGLRLWSRLSGCMGKGERATLREGSASHTSVW